MGCNTSQELNAKEGSVHVLNGSEHENDANDVVEQNANNELPLQQKGGVSNAVTATNSTTTIATIPSNKMDNCYSSDDKKLPNSIANTATQNNLILNSNAMQLSNGDSMNHHNNASKKSPNITTTPPTSKLTPITKENGLIPMAVNGLSNTSISSADTQENVDNTLLGDDEARAAIKIQAVYRGHKARNNMKKADVKNSNATFTINNCSSNHNSAVSGNNIKNGATIAPATLDDSTKAELEAEFDPNDKELCDAARKIQATFRGHLTRKLVAKDADDIDINELTQKVAEELDIDLSDPDLNKAATKIQASFRGHKIRKERAPVSE